MAGRRRPRAPGAVQAGGAAGRGGVGPARDTAARAVLRRPGRRQTKAPPRRHASRVHDLSAPTTASGGAPDAGPQSRRRLTSAPLTDGTPSRSIAQSLRTLVPAATVNRGRDRGEPVRAADDPGYSWGGSPDCSSPEPDRPADADRDRSWVPPSTRRPRPQPLRDEAPRPTPAATAPPPREVRGRQSSWGRQMVRTCSPWSRVRLHVFADLALPPPVWVPARRSRAG